MAHLILPKSLPRWLVSCALSCAIVGDGPAAAQGARVSVSGTAYDSLHRAPLAGALISVVGTARSTLSDSTGRFRFDSLAPGSYTFAAQHDVLDSLGLSAVSAKATVDAAGQAVLLAVPSFATLWRTACPGAPPRDSGFIYGTVRSARSGRPVAGATVDVSWMDYGLSSQRTIAQKRWHNSVPTDATGGFAACGVPDGAVMRIRAATDSMATGLIDLPARTDRVRRRDLVVGPGSDASPVERGAIFGRVTGVGGRPVPNARIRMDEVPETHTSADGRFLLAGIPAGTRQLDIQSLGMTPLSLIIEVGARDTARITAEMKRVTTLGTVQVAGSSARSKRAVEFNDRRRLGIGQFADSTAMVGRTSMGAAFENFSGVHIEHPSGSKTQFLVYVRGVGGDCVATLFMDGLRRTGQEELWFLRPEEVGAVETYPATLVPAEFQLPQQTCGVIAVWTKFALGR